MSVPSGREALAPLRQKIDAVDDAMVDLLAERFRLVSQVAAVKLTHGIPARLAERVEAVVDHVRLKGEAAGCPPDFAEHVWRAMIEWVIGFEERHFSQAPGARD